jgi:hypothetical protein
MNGVETTANPVLLRWNATSGRVGNTHAALALDCQRLQRLLKPSSSESSIHLVRLRLRRQKQIAVIFVNGYF